MNNEEQEAILKFLLKEKKNLIQNTLKIWIALNKGLDYIHINMNQLNKRFKEINEVIIILTFMLKCEIYVLNNLSKQL